MTKVYQKFITVDLKQCLTGFVQCRASSSFACPLVSPGSETWPSLVWTGSNAVRGGAECAESAACFCASRSGVYPGAESDHQGSHGPVTTSVGAVRKAKQAGLLQGVGILPHARLNPWCFSLVLIWNTCSFCCEILASQLLLKATASTKLYTLLRAFAFQGLQEHDHIGSILCCEREIIYISRGGDPSSRWH